MQIQLRSRIYTQQKLGNHSNECEDAVFVREAQDGLLTTEPACYALADGATTGAFSREWAEWLTRDLVEHCQPDESLVQRTSMLRPAWSQHVDPLQLPWYAKAKAQAGAFATLLGLWLMPTPPSEEQGGWESAAVGDTCLFHIRDGHLIQAFPLNHSAAFGSTPHLLSSKPFNSELPEQRTQGDWSNGDRFLLMTDALAAWFLRCHEEGGQPWEAIDAWEHQEDEKESSFATWIGDLRLSHQLRNDDVTLLIIDVNHL